MLPRIALVAAGMLALTSAGAADGDFDPHVWLNPGVFSHHFKEDREYREKNYGLGVEVFLTHRHGLIAGSFMNSNDERSRYVGYHWRPLQLAFDRLRFSGGLVVSLIDGYSDVRDGKTFPLVVPALSAEYRALGAHVIFAPRRERSSALALQLRLRVW
ncbi:MAG TPA: hypothetical protein VFZ81_12650 [Burkholderiales bacterium]